MLLTLNDWIVLAGLLSFCGFVSYTAHEIGNAIHSWLEE
jgi:hypothetical protein